MANFFAEIPIENLENFENFEKKKKSAFSRKKGLTFQILCRKIPWKRDKSRLDTLTILTNWLKKVKFWVPLSSKSKSNSTFNFFCQDKPWKFENLKKNHQNYRSFWRETGRKKLFFNEFEGWKRGEKKIFFDFATPVHFIFKKFEKIWKKKKKIPNLSFVWREREEENFWF